MIPYALTTTPPPLTRTERCMGLRGSPWEALSPHLPTLRVRSLSPPSGFSGKGLFAMLDRPPMHPPKPKPAARPNRWARHRQRQRSGRLIAEIEIGPEETPGPRRVPRSWDSALVAWYRCNYAPSHGRGA